MKISSVSKKVLASALSAAMVVAFSPAAAFAATNNSGNAGETQTPIEGNITIGNGVVTKAATCGVDGYMTFTASDGSETIAIIPATGKHAAYELDTTKGDEDAAGKNTGIAWSFGTASEFAKCNVFVKCAECGETDTLEAVVTNKVIEPTFAAPGKIIYTATAKDKAGKTWTFTKEVVLDQLVVDGAAAEFDLDANGVCRLALTSTTGKTYKYTTASEADVTAANCTDKTKTTYTATFDVSGYTADSIAKLKTVKDETIDKVTIANGTMTIVSTEFETGTVNPENHDGHIAQRGMATQNNTTVTDKVETYNDGGITIVYSGDTGSILDGTALTDGVFWTIEAKCAVDGKVAYTKQIASKVTKSSCANGTFYTISYAGGTFVLGTEATSVTAHTYVAGTPTWTADGKFSIDYTCACGEKVSFTGKYGVATSQVEVKKSAASIPATCQATGIDIWTVTIDATTLADKGIKVADKVTFTSEAYTTAKLTHEAAVYTAAVDWVPASKQAIITLSCKDCAFKKVFKVDMTSVHTNQVGITGTPTKGSTTNYATFTLPEGFVLPTGGVIKNAEGYTLTANNDGSYTLVESNVPDAAVAVYAEDASKDVTKTACWTVTVTNADGTPSKFVPTKVELTEAAATCDTAGKNVYTITYDNGKTLVAEEPVRATAAHTFVFDHFKTTYNQQTGKIESIIAVEKCSVCGKETKEVHYKTYADGFYTFEMTDGSKLVVSEYRATSYAYGAPTFAWTAERNLSTGDLVVAAVATFVSTDGTMKYTTKEIIATLADPETGTYTVTVPSWLLPEGWAGDTAALTATKIFNIHEGHAMVQTEVKKATTSAAGYTKYYCNNDGMTYIVAIAKDNFKLASASKTFKASALKKAKKTVTIKVKNAKGKVSYKATTAAKKAGVTVSTKGKVTVKKGTKKGSYKVTVTSAATSKYAKATKTFTIKVK